MAMSSHQYFLILITFILIFCVDFSSQCFSLGCFGGFGGFGGGCGGSSCLLGLCFQTPMIQPIGCGCGAGYMCIRGGCVARAAAAGTKTFRDESSRPPDLSTTPDEHFATCCSLLEVPDSCNDLCSYSTYSSEEVSAVLLQQSTCPVTAIRKIHFCAARGTNHTECCTKSFVPMHCHSFCDQSQDKDVSDLSIAHLQCVQHFNDIKSCFVEHANSEYFEGFSEDSQSIQQNQETSLRSSF